MIGIRYMLGKNDLLIYMRFVKSGSSTVTEHLKRNYKWYANCDMKSVPNDTRIIAGHLAHYGTHAPYKNRNVKYMTIMRDPADWLVSVYNHDESRKRTGRSFIKWCMDGAPNSVLPQNNVKNKMTAFACWLFEAKNLDECLRRLDDCWFVGITERLNIDFHYLCEWLGINDNWKNYRIAGQYDGLEKLKIDKLCEVNNELREWIYKENPCDMALYNYAKKRNIETRGNLTQ